MNQVVQMISYGPKAYQGEKRSGVMGEKLREEYES